MIELDQSFEMHLARVDADERSLWFPGRDAQGREDRGWHREEVPLDPETIGDGFERIFHAVRRRAVGTKRVRHGGDKGRRVRIGQARAVGFECLKGRRHTQG